MVECQPSKLNTWVRFPSPAPRHTRGGDSVSEAQRWAFHLPRCPEYFSDIRLYFLYAPLAQLDSNRLLSGRSKVRILHGVPPATAGATPVSGFPGRGIFLPRSPENVLFVTQSHLYKTKSIYSPQTARISRLWAVLLLFLKIRTGVYFCRVEEIEPIAPFSYMMCFYLYFVISHRISSL